VCFPVTMLRHITPPLLINGRVVKFRKEPQGTNEVVERCDEISSSLLAFDSE
jgi:hypothetical protein